MKLELREPDHKYSSGSQKAKDITEAWVENSMFCPNCGHLKLNQFPPNLAVADFYCVKCQDQFELKSSKKPFGKKLVNGAYATKIERLDSDTSPNLILLKYASDTLQVEHVCLIPKRFFVSEIVEQRKPLSSTARRAGWVGSNILLEKIPKSGMIYLVRSGLAVNKQSVLESWQKTAFLSEYSQASRGWLLEVMRCVDSLDPMGFSLNDMYKFEAHLGQIYPSNNNVKPKIRQQLQVLRDNGYIEFMGDGNYRLRK